MRLFVMSLNKGYLIVKTDKVFDEIYIYAFLKNQKDK